MPSSFSRFIDESDMDKVRQLYLESLAALEAEELAGDDPVEQRPGADDPEAGRQAVNDRTAEPAPEKGDRR